MRKTVAIFGRLGSAGVFLLVLLAACGQASAEDLPQKSVVTVSVGLAALDWIVLGLYAVAMLWIGVYYSRQNRSADDYLLGGRAMKPWMVGLSMFATFMSVLTYLALPGEMIGHGPMVLANLIGYPVAAVVVCGFIIPYIMRFRVTSGYEILEARFGESVRLLGAMIFLAVRFLWMGLVIYATVDKVFVPVAGLDPAVSPYVCILLGLITVVYASMGGIRAVVMTDAVQAIILVAGAVLALVMISASLGGVSAWWPTRWEPHWDPFRFLPARGSRVSLIEPILGVGLWWIATASSDQMAIQRYLSTRDVRSARRMFGISISANICIALILGMLGFALLAYFQGHPEMLGAGQSVTKTPDQLLPRYMVVGLPAGLTGFVIAALAAATMSSLSAGVNSVSSVIASDLADRFRREPSTESQRLVVAKVASWIVGLVAIGLSLAAAYVPGNLFELCYKIANLFTVPLFMLFFMAMFVPWATTLGAWAAALGSAAVAVAIGYNGPLRNLLSQWGPENPIAAIAIAGLKHLDLGFFWVVIGSLIAGVIVGPLVSLLPIGKGPQSRLTDLLGNRPPAKRS